MTRVRIALVAAIACMAIGGTVISDAVAAPAKNAAPTIYKKHVTGFTNGKQSFSGTYAIQRFVVTKPKGSKRGVYAVGTLTGNLNGHHVSRKNVMMPAKLTNTDPSATKTTKSTRQAGPTCQLLFLTLGPINLDLLGLHLTIAGGTPANQVPIFVNLTGTQGGGLLGSLLCGLDNALGSSSILSQLTGELQTLANTLQGILTLLGSGLGGL
jgi:hypothetical protein